DRETLCVSSQVGCALGCRFCETAQMGLLRNLAVDEIVGQWFAARHHLHRSIRNVVFMGMGEPMENLDNVLGAIDVLTDPVGVALAPARITVSTVGRVAGIRRLTQYADSPGRRRVRLAVSINAPDDELRSQLMPINRSTPLSELMEAMLDWTRRPGRRVLIEYVLIPGVNDGPEHAERLCRYLGALPCLVNVIPYNPRRGSPWPAPGEAIVVRFAEAIRRKGFSVRRRQTHGRDVMAACGQLGSASA
ncbi:MAG: 23S rRNA (adenine(2503)-C(2))-methyltransferase RlmN, partial [Planctomycetota bacterium]